MVVPSGSRGRGSVQVRVIHNASIMNAIGACGLQLYRFGQTVSIVFFTDTWRPDSFYDKIAANARLGLHTLCLLDIKVKEPTLDSLARGKPVYAPPRFMTVRRLAAAAAHQHSSANTLSKTDRQTRNDEA